MPIHRGTDALGYYYQWGQHGHKYYYAPGNGLSRQYARERARKQARAAYSRGYRE